MHRMSHAARTAPSAWRGLQNPASSRIALSRSVAKEFQKHPIETLGFIAAAIAMARLAFTPSKKEPAASGDTLVARRRSRH
jgi:hypothetical protein